MVGRTIRTETDEAAVKEAIRVLLLAQHRAPRVDVFINGMATVQEQQENSVKGLQEVLDLLEGVQGTTLTGGLRFEASRHVPVIGVYNRTSISKDGRAVKADPWDLSDMLENQEDAAFPDRETKNEDTLRLIAVLRSVVEVLWSVEFEEQILEKWAREPEGREGGWRWLENIRKRLTLHAHSQGARIAAVARTRLGEIAPTRRTGEPAPLPLDVADQFDYVDYGNGAGTSMWWHPKGYRSHLHHINQNDFVPMAFGVSLIGQNINLEGLLLEDLYAWSNLKLQDLGFLMAPNHLFPSIENKWINIGLNIGRGPVEPFARWISAGKSLYQNHGTLFHPSTCKMPNEDSHDIINAYLCNVIRSRDVLVKYPKIQTPLQGQWGTFNMWLGPQICEYGDCGGSSNEYDVADDSRVPLMGHLKVEIHGDLPSEVEPSIGIQQMATTSDPTAYPTLYLNQSTAVHPVKPGTHRVLMRKEVFKGNTYQPHLEQKSPQGWVGLPNQQVEIEIGRLTHIRVSYRRVAP